MYQFLRQDREDGNTTKWNGIGTTKERIASFEEIPNSICEDFDDAPASVYAEWVA